MALSSAIVPAEAQPSRLQAQLTKEVAVTFEFLLEAFCLKYKLYLAEKEGKQTWFYLLQIEQFLSLACIYCFCFFNFLNDLWFCA